MLMKWKNLTANLLKDGMGTRRSKLGLGMLPGYYKHLYHLSNHCLADFETLAHTLAW